MLEAIKSFRLVTDTLATSGQPSESQIGEIGKQGFDMVINLGLMGQPYTLPDEKAAAENAGMVYFHIPVPFDSPARADFDRFLELMDAHAGRKVYLHCAANYRASCFASLYGRARLGWTRERAADSIATVWKPDAVWTAFMDTVEAGSVGSGDAKGGR